MAVINYKVNESRQIDLCTRSIQPTGKDSRWHLKSKIHGKNNKEGSAPQRGTAGASTAGATLPVYFYSCSQHEREKQLGGGEAVWWIG